MVHIFVGGDSDIKIMAELVIPFTLMGFKKVILAPVRVFSLKRTLARGFLVPFRVLNQTKFAG